MNFNINLIIQTVRKVTQNKLLIHARSYIRSHRLICFGVGGILILASLSGFFFIRQTQNAVDTSMLVPQIKTRIIRPSLLLHEIRTPGSVIHLEKASVASKILGRLQAFYVNQGDRVSKGQKLAQMETFELTLRLRQAQAALSSASSRLSLSRARHAGARRNIERQIRNLDRMQSNIIDAKASYLNAEQTLKNRREIYEMGGASEMELKTTYAQYISAMNRYYQSRVDYQAGLVGFRNRDLNAPLHDFSAEQKKEAFVAFNTEVERNEIDVALSAYNSAALEVETAGMMLREASILSPIAGVVVSRAIEIGEEVKQNEPIFTIVRTDRLLVSANVSEEESGGITPGQDSRFTVDARRDESVNAKVLRISPVIDIRTRTAEVQLEFDNQNIKLSPGMFVRCFIASRKKIDGISLPESSFARQREEQGKHTAEIYVIQNNLAFQRIVTLGEKYNDEFEITEGLKPGEEVVLENAQLLKDGAPVKTVRETENRN